MAVRHAIVEHRRPLGWRLLIYGLAALSIGFSIWAFSAGKYEVFALLGLPPTDGVRGIQRIVFGSFGASGFLLLVAAIVHARRKQRIGVYSFDRHVLRINGVSFDLAEPYFATLGRSGGAALVRVAQNGKARSALFPAWPKRTGEDTEPDELTERRLRVYYPELDASRLRCRGARHLGVEIGKALMETVENNTAVEARKKLPPPSRPPDPELRTALEIPFGAGEPGRGAGFRSGRPTPRDGASFVMDTKATATEVTEGLYLTADYLVHVRDGAALVLPIGCVKALAAGRELRLSALGEDGRPLGAVIVMPDVALAHVLAEDLEIAFDEAQSVKRR